MTKKITVLVDTREKQPWTFTNATTIEVMSCKLDTGDYTVMGLENQLCIERKKSVTELAQNVVQQRFWNEVERMRPFRWKFLVLEFDYRQIIDYPQSADLPKHIKDKIKLDGAFLLRQVNRLQTQYNVHIVPCSHTIYAQQVVISIIKRIYELDSVSTKITT